jgi:hypothetical protein
MTNGTTRNPKPKPKIISDWGERSWTSIQPSIASLLECKKKSREARKFDRCMRQTIGQIKLRWQRSKKVMP